LSADRDVFTSDEMITAFDVVDVNPNPARFDQKKADAINADHIRLLDEDDFGRRILPYLIAGGALPVEPSEAQLATVRAAVPLVQSRVTVLSEVVGMMGFLFSTADQLEYQDDALKSLGDDASQVLAAGIAALEALPDDQWSTESIQAALQGALIDGLGLKPRVAFGALRVAASGRRVSPPLFESFELLGREQTLARLRRLAERLEGNA
jgi:glutamyl-tRNA synthetase